MEKLNKEEIEAIKNMSETDKFLYSRVRGMATKRTRMINRYRAQKKQEEQKKK